MDFWPICMECIVTKKKNTQEVREVLRSIRKLDSRIKLAKKADKRLLLTLKMEMVLFYIDLKNGKGIQ